MAPARNELCSCGSGKKYKNCCAEKRERSSLMATLGVAAFILITGWVVAEIIRASSNTGERVVPPGYVWSEEHGHPHKLGGSEGQALPAQLPPAGSIWSEEHSHYHGPGGTEIRWSDEQNSWVDTSGNPV